MKKIHKTLLFSMLAAACLLCVGNIPARAEVPAPATENKSGYINEKGEFIEFGGHSKSESKEDSKVVKTIKSTTSEFWESTKQFIPVAIILGVIMVVMFFVVKPVKNPEIDTEKKIK